ncbi:glycosyl transferase family 2 [Candidatus Magnetomorum sp. HK-1]|nr:glycosyl transferase family 2 [Candidatus Magnetomorum sp. HK-1]
MIRTKDRPSLLREAIESVACQNYPNIELVVVNDGGEDVSELVNAFSDKVFRNIYISLNQNQGRSAAANACLDNATGDYLIFLDDDDLFEPHHISRLVKALKENANYQAAYTDIHVTGIMNDYFFDYPCNSDRLKIENFIPIIALMFEKSLLKKGCRFDKQLLIFEDWDFLLQLSCLTSFWHIQGISARYRNLGTSGSIKNDEICIQMKIYIFEKWRKQWTGKDILNIINYLKRNKSEAMKSNENIIKDINQKLVLQSDELQSKNNELEKTYYDLTKYKSEINSLKQTNRELYNKLHYNITEYKSEIDLFYSSMSWKITAPLRYMMDKILPENTKRRNIVNRILNFRSLSSSCDDR